MITRRSNLILFAVLLAASALSAPLNAQGPTPTQIQTAVNAAYEKYRNLQEGKNADYIPALARVNPNLFGVAVG